MKKPDKTITAGKRLSVVSLCGLVVGAALVWNGQADYATLAAWDTAAVLYVVWSLATILHFDADQTRTHATSENPGRAIADVLLIVASVASLVAVGLLVLHASTSSGLEKGMAIGLGLASVIVSWAIVHTTYLLKYARLYYNDSSSGGDSNSDSRSSEGGISFNQKSAPNYSDFAYLAFTIGMTYQVSDTDIQTKEIRATILRHALLSFLFGTVIIATTINTLASLSK